MAGCGPSTISLPISPQPLPTNASTPSTAQRGRTSTPPMPMRSALSASWASYKQALAASPEIGEANEYKALRDAFAAVSRRALYLVNSTIQVALSHHLDDE